MRWRSWSSKKATFGCALATVCLLTLTSLVVEHNRREEFAQNRILFSALLLPPEGNPSTGGSGPNRQSKAIEGAPEIDENGPPPESDLIQNEPIRKNKPSQAVQQPPYRRGLWFDQAESTEAYEEEEAQNWTASPAAGNTIDPSALSALLPHLRLRCYRHLSTLNARVLLRAGNVLRSPPELLLVVPSTHRKEHNYLADTLHNLVSNVAPEERHLAQIVVVLSENPWEPEAESHLQKAVSAIWRDFKSEVLDGFLEVVAPPREWFPPHLGHQLRPTLGDSPERMRWRTKQSLDYAFAMLHARMERPNARFYVQLEDDIQTVPAYLSEMRRLAHAHPHFFMVEFANLGFIGHMFHNGEDLLRLAHFILILHRRIPVDWILTQFLHSNFCSLDETVEQCHKKRLTDIVLFRRSPALFQHVGKHSSLTGKVQDQQEPQFGQNEPIHLLRAQNPAPSEFRSPTAGVADPQQWRALYERFVPVQLDGAALGEAESVEIVYGEAPIKELKGLRILFAVQFRSNVSALPFELPQSLLQVHIHQHSSDNNWTLPYVVDQAPFRSSAPDQQQPPQHDHFLFRADQQSGGPALRDIRSVRICLAQGQWRNWVHRLVLSAITVLL